MSVRVASSRRMLRRAPRPKLLLRKMSDPPGEVVLEAAGLQLPAAGPPNLSFAL